MVNVNAKDDMALLLLLIVALWERRENEPQLIQVNLGIRANYVSMYDLSMIRNQVLPINNTNYISEHSMFVSGLP